MIERWLRDENRLAYDAYAALPDWELPCPSDGTPLTGRYLHECPDQEDAPFDETCEGWPCACARGWGVANG